jgi:hypothetical protein
MSKTMNSYPSLPFIFKMALIFQCCFGAAEARGERIFASNVQAFINNSQTNVQSILDRLTPKSVDLKDLTTTTSELNILHGIQSTVTTQSLNTLTAGSTSDADSLHTHASGIGNASTIDNLDSAQFVRSDVSDTFEGDLLTLNGDLELSAGGNITTTANGTLTFNPNGTGIIRLGTTDNETAVALSGDLTVTGTLTTPGMMLLEQEVYDLKKEITDLKFAVQELLEKKVR